MKNAAEITYHEISQGLGVEDIAVTHGIKLSEVQIIVGTMRKHGMINKLFPRKAIAAQS